MKHRASLSALPLLAALAADAAAQTLWCGGQEVRPFSSYTVSVGRQKGPNITLNQQLFSGSAHNAIISKGSDTESYLVIDGQIGSEAELVSETTEQAACSTPGMKPKFYSTNNRAGRIRLIPNMPLSASIKACPYRWLAAKCSRTITIGGISYTANRGYPPCTGIGGGDEVAAENVPDPNPNQQVDPGGFTAMPRTTASGATLKIRVYGKLCIRGNQLQNCTQFETGNRRRPVGIGVTCSDVHRRGYTATFVPGPNCGPPKWPSAQLKKAYNNGDSRFQPYSEWYDFTVTP